VRKIIRRTTPYIYRATTKKRNRNEKERPVSMDIASEKSKRKRTFGHPDNYIEPHERNEQTMRPPKSKRGRSRNQMQRSTGRETRAAGETNRRNMQAS